MASFITDKIQHHKTWHRPCH